MPEAMLGEILCFHIDEELDCGLMTPCSLVDS
jgi:hypothetical protein